MKHRDQLCDQIARMERAVAMFDDGRDPLISLRELEETRQSLKAVEAICYDEVDNDVDGDVVDAIVTNEDAEDAEHDETVKLSDEDMETGEKVPDENSTGSLISWFSL